MMERRVLLTPNLTLEMQKAYRYTKRMSRLDNLEMGKIKDAH